MVMHTKLGMAVLYVHAVTLSSVEAPTFVTTYSRPRTLLVPGLHVVTVSSSLARPSPVTRAPLWYSAKATHGEINGFKKST